MDHSMSNAGDAAKPALHDPGRWLAVLRIVVGLWFLKALWLKLELVGGWLPLPVASERWVEALPRIVSGWAQVNPLPWYRGFLEQVVVTNAAVFANLTALGNVAIGLGLTTGFLCGVAAILGLIIVMAYELGALGLPLPGHGLRIVMWFAMLAFLFARAGRVWGLDGWLARRHPDSPLGRFPLS